MFKTRTPLLLGLLWLAATALTFGQTVATDKESALRGGPDTTVTISVSEAGVRFASPALIGQMRLEVFGAGGESVYNSGFQPASVRDWRVRGGEAQAVPDGRYLCVVTVRELSGRLSTRQGTVLVQGGQASLQMEAGADVSAAEAGQALSKASEATAATLTVHDGEQGQVVSTRGGLSFRAGDFFAGRDEEVMRVTPDGNLGVGTSSPQARLDVAGTVLARGGIRFSDGTTMTTAPADQPSSAAAAGTGTTGRLSKWLETGGAGTLGDSSVFETGGFVGIGTTAPEGTLHIQTPDTTVFKVTTVGSAATGRAVFQMYRGTAAAANGFDFGYNTDLSTESFIIRELSNGSPASRFAIQKNTGNIGIGTTAPQEKLEVAGKLKLSGAGAGIVFADGSIQTSATAGGGGGGGGGGVSGAGTPTKVPVWSGSTALSDSLITQSGGAVAVGGNLSAAGNVTATGTISGGNVIAKYQDVAEWVPSRERIAAGTVVVLDQTQNNAVLASRRAYSTHVAGVVSAQPGVILGEGGEGKVMVATTGRVKVRVDARRGAIRIGDLLVTSGREGVAMRSRPVRAGRAVLHRPGTIIGKALEPLAKGEGEILVLLSLQ